MPDSNQIVGRARGAELLGVGNPPPHTPGVTSVVSVVVVRKEKEKHRRENWDFLKQSRMEQRGEIQPSR